jgi:hypothetical protein
MVQINCIEAGGNTVKKFLSKLTQREDDLLSLVHIPSDSFRQGGNAVSDG